MLVDGVVVVDGVVELVGVVWAVVDGTVDDVVGVV